MTTVLQELQDLQMISLIFFRYTFHYNKTKKEILKYTTSIWFSDINNSFKLSPYCLYEHEFMLQSYKDNIPVAFVVLMRNCIMT